YFYTVTSEHNGSEESIHFSFDDNSRKIEIVHAYPENFDKYCILEERKGFLNKEVNRIMAMRSFLVRGHILVVMGDIGGYVEKEENLSHEGMCWVFNHAMVYDKAVIKDNAVVSLNAQVCGQAIVSGNSMVTDNAKVYDFAEIKDDALIHYRAEVYGYSVIEDTAAVGGNAKVYGNA
ncbi:hypothetical protein, partial [Neisseria sp. P0024.S002]|uniref:hypothetical protein n=1 Tax=Neisseria sp. P0024.S002 TaxID=3436846 RepID=UPI003F81488B